MNMQFYVNSKRQTKLIYCDIYRTFAFALRCSHRKVIRISDKITDNWNLTRYCIRQTKGAVHLQAYLHIVMVWSFWNPQMTYHYRLCSLRYLNWCWFAINLTIGNILQWSVNRHTINCVDEDWFENFVCRLGPFCLCHILIILNNGFTACCWHAWTASKFSKFSGVNEMALRY